MKTKLLTLGLAVALCGIAEAAETPKKFTVNVESNDNQHRIAVVDESGRVHASAEYDSETCLHTSIPGGYTKEARMMLIKAALNHGYKNGCAGKYFKTYWQFAKECERAGAVIERDDNDSNNSYNVHFVPRGISGKIKKIFGFSPF